MMTKKNENIERYDYCMYCKCDHNDDKVLSDKIVNCWKCYNWYHQRCGNKC